MNVIEELIEDRVDRGYVERRVEEWLRTIDQLYADIADWLPEGWRAWKDGSVPMREELMQRFDVAERELPVLQLQGPAHRRGRVEPRGLWIIGANGRIDLILPPRHFLLVNREESFEAPRWQLSTLEERKSQRLFTRDVLLDVLV